MKIWNKWTVAIETRREWLALYGYKKSDIKSELEALGANPTYEDVARITKFATYVPRCDECGK